jgi:hypothetical protein
MTMECFLHGPTKGSSWAPGLSLRLFAPTTNQCFQCNLVRFSDKAIIAFLHVWKPLLEPIALTIAKDDGVART